MALVEIMPSEHSERIREARKAQGIVKKVTGD
jgi:hypothetical protein